MKNITKLSLMAFVFLLSISVQQVKAGTNTEGNTIGNSKAPITLEIWESFSDPFGVRFQKTIEKVQKHYGDKIKFVYKPFPLASLFPSDVLAAHAAECASKNGFYKEFRKYIFSPEGRTDLDNGTIDGNGSKYFLKAEYVNCLKKDGYTYVTDYLIEGQNKNIMGVPTSFAIRNKDKKEIKIGGAQPFEDVILNIDELLNEKEVEQKTTTKNKTRQNISFSSASIEYPEGSDLGSGGYTKDMKITASIKNNEYAPISLSGAKAKYTIYLYDVTNKNKKIGKVAAGEVLIPYRNGYSEFSAYIEMGEPFDGRNYEKEYKALIKIEAPKGFKESSTKDNSFWTDSWDVTYYKG